MNEDDDWRDKHMTFLVSIILGIVNDIIIDGIQINVVLRFSTIIAKMLVTPITIVIFL